MWRDIAGNRPELRVSVDSSRDTNILMGTVQGGGGARCARYAAQRRHSTRARDPRILFATQREAMTKAITKALAQEPSIDWLLEHQDSIEHYFHGLALKGEL